MALTTFKEGLVEGEKYNQKVRPSFCVLPYFIICIITILRLSLSIFLHILFKFN